MRANLCLEGELRILQVLLQAPLDSSRRRDEDNPGDPASMCVRMGTHVAVLPARGEAAASSLRTPNAAFPRDSSFFGTTAQPILFHLLSPPQAVSKVLVVSIRQCTQMLESAQVLAILLSPFCRAEGSVLQPQTLEQNPAACVWPLAGKKLQLHKKRQNHILTSMYFFSRPYGNLGTYTNEKQALELW